MKLSVSGRVSSAVTTVVDTGNFIGACDLKTVRGDTLFRAQLGILGWVMTLMSWQVKRGLMDEKWCR